MHKHEIFDSVNFAKGRTYDVDRHFHIFGRYSVLIGVLWAMSPGQPEPFLDENGKPLAGRISEKILVVWWKQRGASLSYSPDIPPETMTAKQFVDDTIRVKKFMRE